MGASGNHMVPELQRVGSVCTGVPTGMEGMAGRVLWADMAADGGDRRVDMTATGTQQTGPTTGDQKAS